VTTRGTDRALTRGGEIQTEASLLGATVLRINRLT
jgi:hypothetical protein